MKKVYNYAVLNEFFNTDATPQEIKGRLYEILRGDKDDATH